MNPSAGPPDRRYFPLTRLTLLARARSTDALDRTSALEEFARLYWWPLHCFLARSGAGDEEATDLVQGFVVSLLENEVLVKFDPARGKFRSYLLACLKGYRGDEVDRARAAKRGGRAVVLSIGEAGAALEVPAPDLTPEEAYERAWAVSRMRWAVGEVRRELSSAGEEKAVVLLDLYLQVANPNRPGHAELGEAAGLEPKKVRYLLEHLRKRIRQTLLEELEEETGSPAAAREELDWLLATLA